MSNAQLRKQGVDRGHLNSVAPAQIAQFSSVDVIPPIRRNERQRRESLDDVFPSARPCKSLQQFLKNKPGGNDDLIDDKVTCATARS